MVKMTQSFQQFIVKFHRDLLVPIMFGHLENVNEELYREYLDWCQTEEGRQYLRGGKLYKEEENESV